MICPACGLYVEAGNPNLGLGYCSHENALALQQENAALKTTCIKNEHEIEQILGKVLGYPWFKDDKQNFPDATEADGVCVGEHIAVTLAMEISNKYAALKAELDHVGSQRGGCCDHGCLIDPPSVGTTGGKCYCSQGKVRRHIKELKAQIEAGELHLAELKALELKVLPTIQEMSGSINGITEGKPLKEYLELIDEDF